MSIHPFQANIKIEKKPWSFESDDAELCHSEHLCFLRQPVFQISRHSRQMNKKRFRIQTDLLSWVHPEHKIQSHGFRFGAGICLAGQLCVSQCGHTVIQERE